MSVCRDHDCYSNLALRYPAKNISRLIILRTGDSCVMRAGLWSEQSGFEPCPSHCCCVLGTDSSLSRCPPPAPSCMDKLMNECLKDGKIRKAIWFLQLRIELQSALIRHFSVKYIVQALNDE